MRNHSIRTARRVTQGLAAALAVTVTLTLGGCGGGGAKTVKADYADRVLVKKSERKLQLLKSGQVLKEYKVSLSDNPRGHKIQEGDKRTPVGDYILDWRNPNSNYHKAIHVSYPNARDVQLAQYLGVQPGGMIMLHGLPNGTTSPVVRADYHKLDWTNGCIALQDQDIDEIWRLVRDGTPIRITE
ncbi:L,D-transpeptidase family protein [uncultured Thiodictyon sp.]|uniref:L,D-transpeptidase family protein n=1 Tax=uncultured Thiodictyon sp. TaxID=1846217 RepID=UPI0025D029B3|nr:L,D-transpeptidase family protein [uncultured Thiodictyon sp.]